MYFTTSLLQEPGIAMTPLAEHLMMIARERQARLISVCFLPGDHSAVKVEHWTASKYVCVWEGADATTLAATPGV